MTEMQAGQGPGCGAARPAGGCETMARGVRVAVALMLVTLVFARLMKAQTQAGRKLLDLADGLKLYMGVADLERLHALDVPAAGSPPLDEARYQALLPYALALGVEEAWTHKFTLAVGAAAAAAAAGSVAWYSGSGSFTNFSDMSSSLGSSLDGAISSAATAPGSSSGGGGFSGGGGGGGGGGGW